MSTPQASDDLSIPAFLRRKPGVSTGSASTPGQATAHVEHVDDWQIELAKIEPAEFRQYVEQKMNQGRFARRWLVVRLPYHTQNQVDETVSSFRKKWEERKLKAEANAEAARKRLEEVREASPTRGMVPLREVLEGMGEGAPRRKHAIAAIDAAKLEHIKYHFPKNSPVIIARVQQVLREYVPPVKPKGKHEFDKSLVITWSGKNPKAAGTDAHARWEKLRLHDGKTVGEFVADGGNTTTLKNALERGTVKFKGGPDGGHRGDGKQGKGKDDGPAKAGAREKSAKTRGRVRGVHGRNAGRSKGVRAKGRQRPGKR